ATMERKDIGVAERERAVEDAEGGCVIMLVERDHEAGDAERRRIVATRRGRRMSVTDRGGAVRLAEAEAVAEVIAPGERRMRLRIAVFDLKRLFQERDRRRRVLGGVAVGIGQRAQHQVVRIEILRALAPDALDLGPPQARLDGADDAHGKLVLQREDVVELAVVTLGPDMGAGLRLDELS